MKARDVMVSVKAYLKPEQGLAEFVAAIKKAREMEKTCDVRTLPVLDDSGKIVGIISMCDILDAIHPSYLYATDLHSFTWDGMLESLAGKAAGKKVSDLMKRDIITVKYDHPLMECVDHILKHRISTLPVVDGDGRLLGMLYESDIFFAVTNTIFGGK